LIGTQTSLKAPLMRTLDFALRSVKVNTSAYNDRAMNPVKRNDASRNCR